MYGEVGLPQAGALGALSLGTVGAAAAHLLWAWILIVALLSVLAMIPRKAGAWK